jgi:nucleotide-binding universal stress UspA family protein
LQATAAEMDADLIVAGAHGHSRLKERIFGGVTRSLLAGTRFPLLMSHSSAAAEIAPGQEHGLLA